MLEHAWICLHKQDSKYVLGPKYAKILNMANFWIWQRSQYASDTQSWLDRVQNKFGKYTRILNYDKILNIQELHRVLNMP